MIESKHSMPWIRCALLISFFIFHSYHLHLRFGLCILNLHSIFWILHLPLCTLKRCMEDMISAYIELISKHSFENIIFMGRICVMHGVILNYLSHYRVSHRSYTHLIIHSCRHNAFPRILHIRHSNQNREQCIIYVCFLM